MYRFHGDFWPLLLSFFVRGGEKPISSDAMQGIGRADSLNVCFNDGVYSWFWEIRKLEKASKSKHLTKYHTNGYWVGSFHVASSPRRHLLARLAPGCDSNCSRKGLNDQDSMVRMVLLTQVLLTHLLLLFGSLFTAVHSWGEKKQTHRKNICRKPVKGFPGGGPKTYLQNSFGCHLFNFCFQKMLC